MSRSPSASSRPSARPIAILTGIFAVLTVLAIAVPVWIEEVTGLSPDGGNGELELVLALPFGLAALACGALTVRARRLARA